MSAILRIVFALAGAGSLGAQGVITTIAGTDLFFPPVKGFPAANLPLLQDSAPSLATDAQGNVYLSSNSLCQVFRITPAGVADTVAGNGICGREGDGGPATRAAVFPTGLAVDSVGNVLVSEGDRIRRVTPAGAISTLPVTGPIRISATGPNPLVADRNGNLFFIDRDSRLIRRIAPSGAVSNFAGNGQPGLCIAGDVATAMPFSARSLAIDLNGNLFVNMENTFTVCRVTPDGRVTRLPDALRSESGLAIAPNGDLLASNPFDAVVYSLSPAGTIRVIGGTKDAQGSTGDGGPATLATICATSLAVAPDGAISVWDRCAGRLRRISTVGAISALAGSTQLPGAGDSASTASIGSPFNVASDSRGNVYFATDVQVLRVATSGILTLVAGTGERRTAGVSTGLDGRRATLAVLNVTDIAVTPQDELLILNARGQILRVTPDGIFRVVAGDGSGPPSGDDGPANAARIFPTVAIAAGPDGSIYLAQGSEHRVRRIRPDGIIVKFAGTGIAGSSGLDGPAGSAQLNTPTVIAVDRQGNVYIGETGGPSGGASANRLRVAGLDGILRARADLPTFGSLAADANGNVYATLLSPARIISVSPTGAVTTFAGSAAAGGLGDGLLATQARLTAPFDAVVGPNGDVLIADVQSRRIRAVLAQPPTFAVSTAELRFSAASGGPPARTQTLSVSSPVRGLEFSVTVPQDAAWCRASLTEGQTPRLIEISINPTGLSPGTYETNLTIRAPLASPETVSLRIIATVGPSLPPRLDSPQKSLTFTVPRSTPVRTLPLVVSNSGGGTVDFTAASSTQSGSWLSLASAKGTVAAGSPALLTVTADPRGLGPGTYSGAVTLVGSDGSTLSIPVILTVSRLETAILLSQSGLSFVAVAGGGRLPPQDLAVLNIGTGRMPWSASFTPLTPGNWLQLSTTQDVSDASSSLVPSIDATIDQTGLVPGRYFGQISVNAPDAANSPQVVTVVLDVVRPEDSPGAIIRPAELLLGQGSGGLSPTSSSDVLIYNPATVPLAFSAARSPELFTGNFDFVAVAPLSATVQPDRPLLMTLQPRQLQNGTGTVNLQFSDGNVRSLRVRLTVPSSSQVSANRSAGGCGATALTPAFLSIGQGSTLTAGAPSAVVAEIKDNCGEPMVGPGSAIVYFSNGDAPIALVPLKDGRWHGTWQVRSGALAQVSVRMEAEDPARGLRGVTETSTDLRAATEPPVLSSEGIVSAAQAAAFQPVAPGGMITVYGERLAEFLDTATATPLPLRLGNSELLMAGRRLPVLFASPGQVNAIVPTDLEPNTQHQLVVRRGNTYSIPVAVNAGPAQPGVFTSDGRRAIAVVYRNSETFLTSPANPVRSGDVLVIYCTGLGPVTPPVATGAATPGSPLSRLDSPVRALMGAVDVAVDVAGLVPGFVALYQVNLRLPAGLPTGNEVPLVLETLGQKSPPSYLSVQ